MLFVFKELEKKDEKWLIVAPLDIHAKRVKNKNIGLKMSWEVTGGTLVFFKSDKWRNTKLFLLDHYIATRYQTLRLVLTMAIFKVVIFLDVYKSTKKSKNTYKIVNFY